MNPSKWLIMFVVLLIVFIIRGNVNPQTFLGPPTWASISGETIAGNLVQQGLRQVSIDRRRADGFQFYEIALKGFEKGLKKLQKSHEKTRNKELNHMKYLMEDLQRYTPGASDVNERQQKKQEKIYEYIIKCQDCERES